MPNTTTAKKNLRKTITRTLRNKAQNSQLKTFKKKAILTAVELAKPGINSDTVIAGIRSFIGKVHSLSRKNTFAKLRAARFERRLIAKIRKSCA